MDQQPATPRPVRRPPTQAELEAEDARALADMAARGQYPAPWRGDVDDLDDE